MKEGIIIFFVLILASPVLSQKYFLSYFGENEGLSNSKVNAAFQDSYGQMWIATDGGIHLFNGVEFKLMKRGIPSRYIRDIELKDKYSFVISHDAGISVAKPILDSLIILDGFPGKDSNLEIATKYPNRLHLDHAGRLWISQPNGALIRFDGQKSESILQEELKKNESKTHFCFSEINTEDFFISSPSGSLYFWKAESESLKFIQDNFPTEDILFVNGKLYLAGEKLAAYSWSESTNSINLSWQSDRTDLNFTALAADTLGQIYIGTDSQGLFQLDPRTVNPKLLKVFSNNDPHRVDKLPFKHINSLLISRDNSIWVCSDEGLGLLQRRFFEGTTNLPNDNATTLALAENGNIYVAMGDVYKIKKSGKGFKAQKLNPPNVGAFNALAVDHKDLWSGTNNGKLVQMDLNGRLKKVYSFSERGAGIFRICADSENRKWFCQAPKGHPIFGLAMIDVNGEIKMYDESKGLENRMLIVKESAKKEIYTAGIGTSTYLYKYLPAEDEFVNMSIPFTFPVSPNFEVHDIAIDEQGLVWLATTDGLMRHDMENIIRPDLGPKYTGNEIRAVAVLPDKSIWMSTDIYGMLRYKDGEVLSFGEDSGLPTKIMAYRGILVDQDLKLWVNTLEGVAHTSQDFPNAIATQTPIFRSASYKAKPLYYEGVVNEIISNGILKTNFISFVYPGTQTEYQYRLENDIDDQWIHLGNFNSTALSLDNPDITGFEIRGKKSGGYGWSESNKISFAIKLPWLKRPANQILLLFLAAVLIILIWRLNSRRYKRKITNLESRLQEKSHLLSKEAIEIEDLQAKAQSGKSDVNKFLLASLDLIYEVTENTDAGMKWDHILEHLSIAKLKLPHTVAFEIGILNKGSNKLLIEGYSHANKGFYQREEEWARLLSIYSDTIMTQKAICFDGSEIDRDHYSKWTGAFQTIISVPFILGGKKDAVIALYGYKELDNEYVLKAIKSIANYLELLS